MLAKEEKPVRRDRPVAARGKQGQPFGAAPCAFSILTRGKSMVSGEIARPGESWSPR